MKKSEFKAAMEALRMAGFPIRWADIREGHQDGYVRPYHVTEYADFHDTPRPYVMLGSVAAGDDRYDQTSTCLRSNYRVLTNEYSGVFVPTSYRNRDDLGAFVQDLTPELVDILVGLAVDYPIYDESDVSGLESAEITESWDAYLYSDWHQSAGDEWTDVASLFSSETFGKPETEIADAFWEALAAMDYAPEHSGLDVQWDNEIVDSAMKSALCALVTKAFAPDGIEQDALW